MVNLDTAAALGVDTGVFSSLGSSMVEVHTTQE